MIYDPEIYQEVKLVKKVGRHEFAYKTWQHKEDGSVAWNEDHEKEFRNWLNDIYKNEKEALTIQRVKVNAGLNTLINSFKDEFGEFAVATLIKASVYSYFRAIKDDSLSMKIEKAYSSKEFAVFLDAKESGSYKVRLNPALYLEFQGWATFCGQTMAGTMEEALKRMMACYWAYKVVRADGDIVSAYESLLKAMALAA